MPAKSAPFAPPERGGVQRANGVAREALTENQVLREPVSGREQRLLHLLDRQAESFRDLLQAEAVDLAEQIGTPLPVGKRLERRDQSTARSMRGVRVFRVLLELDAARGLLAAGEELERGVLRDPVQPRTNVLGLCPPTKCLVRVQERLLRDVLAAGAIAEKPGPVAGEAPGIAAIQLVEGSIVTLADSTGEALVRERVRKEGADAPRAIVEGQLLGRPHRY